MAERSFKTDPLSSPMQVDIDALGSENTDLREQVQTLQREIARLRRLADHDPLCPVLNRRAFQRELDREISRAERYNRFLSVLFIDLDEFKALNDTEGHEAGDEALINIAKALQSMVRKTDIVGRLGGDEFGVILIETDTSQSNFRVDMLEEHLAMATGGKLRASIGAASWSKGETSDQLLAAADRAMFARKTSVKIARNT